MLVTINRGAEALEIDRAVLVRACRNLQPAAGNSKRPLYRLADLANALAQHRGRPDGRLAVVRDAPSPELAGMFAEFERLDADVRTAKTVQGARERLAPLLDHLVTLVAAMLRDSERASEPNGEHRIKTFETTVLWTLREPTGLSFEELVGMFSKAAATDDDGDNDE
jgi:hypothetical protein